MPNWCENILHGPKEILETFISKDDEGNEFFDFNKIVPMPEHQPDLTKPNPFFAVGGLGDKEEKDFGENNWYHWSIKNWGTKWNACHSQVNSIVDGVIYFDTAWSPAEKIFAVLIEKYPEHDWTLYYDEGGMCFRGEVIYSGGDPDNVIEVDMSWHYHVGSEAECPNPECLGKYMTTGEGDQEHVEKNCEECEAALFFNAEGQQIKRSEDLKSWVIVPTSKDV